MLAVTDTKKLNTLIAGVKTSGKAFEAKLHLAAFSCLTVADGGDIRPLERLYSALGGKVLKSALAEWSNAFGKVKIVEATETEAHTVSYVKAKESNLADAALIPVSDYKPAVSAGGAGSAFQLAKKLAQTIKGATKEGVSLSAEETRALGMVEQALALLDPEFKPTSNVIPMPKAKRPAKAKAAEEAAAA